MHFKIANNSHLTLLGVNASTSVAGVEFLQTKPNNKPMPTIIEIPIKDVYTDLFDELSGRTPKERAANAKDLAPMLKEGWDESQPGLILKRDGKWQVSAGFTRVYAIKEILETSGAVGYFVEVSDDRAKLRTACIRTNAGKGISTLAMGRLFIRMEAGDDPETLAVGQVAIGGMSVAEIAAETGVSKQRISFCVALAKSSPEIQQLMEEDKVTYTVVDAAKRAATSKDADGKPVLDEAKQLRAIKAAIRNAVADGKEQAAMPNFEAIKADLFPLKAAKPATPAPAAKKGKDDEEEEGTQSDPEPPESNAADDDETPAPESKPALSGGQPSLNLGGDAPAKVKPLTGEAKKEARQKLIDGFSVILAHADSELKNFDDDDDIEHYATALADSGATLPESPM